MSVVDLVIRDDEPSTEPDVRQTKLDMANNDNVDALEHAVQKLAELLAAIRWLNNQKTSNRSQQDTIRDTLVLRAKDLVNEVRVRF
jgi:hypothetical protein